MNRGRTLWILIGLQVVYVLFVAVWLFMAFMSLMMFNDASVFAETNTWLYIAYILAYPLALLAALIAGWILFAHRKYRAALLWNGLPLLWILSTLGIVPYADLLW